MSEPLFKKATRLVQRHGLAGAYAHVVKVIGKNLTERQEERRSAAEEAEFDRRRGVHTSARIEPETLNVIGPHRASAVRYQPISESSFRTLLGALTGLLGSGISRYAFIDLGCGMGKVLLLATEYPFRQTGCRICAGPGCRLREKSARRPGDGGPPLQISQRRGGGRGRVFLS
jgi:hypothetical protein